MNQVNEIKHPLVQHLIGQLREHNRSPAQFRPVVDRLSYLLCYEALKNFATVPEEIRTWAGSTKVERLGDSGITVVPILRAGLGMLNGVMDLLPGASVSVVGFERNEETLQPHAYYEKWAPNVAEKTALVIDPMLATGGTFLATVECLKAVGCQRVHGVFLLAAPEGLDELNRQHPDVLVTVAAVDERLNELGYIIPGLGDAGDRIFNTVVKK
ncbi:uracil phosphoribosyltransferase [Marinicella pacifica]|uniref:Uracil phosphoribosyltransferase n=1 Tax=Marinicella pacifica TaxID=1171543 RepID=A0A917CI08_9GAMM|nr:uracil phosphoribosyltransferase [Marinicella pacifica]GGF89174.1 uracil phosphoribosyltransferase [Marinicella pacifica]